MMHWLWTDKIFQEIRDEYKGEDWPLTSRDEEAQLQCQDRENGECSE